AVADGATLDRGPGERIALVLVSHLAGVQNIIVELSNCGSIGDRVWWDVNNNHLQDITPLYGNLLQPTVVTGYKYEAGINGVTVVLTDNSTGFLTSTVTGPSPYNYPFLPPGTDGYYQFPGLCPGRSYSVSLNMSQPSLGGATATTPANTGSDRGA